MLQGESRGGESQAGLDGEVGFEEEVDLREDRDWKERLGTQDRRAREEVGGVEDGKRRWCRWRCRSRIDEVNIREDFRVFNCIAILKCLENCRLIEMYVGKNN